MAVVAGATAGVLTVSVATAQHARAATESVLVVLQGGESTAPETAILEGAGYTVTSVTPATLRGMTQATFQGYAALIIGDPSSGGTCSTLQATTGTTGSDPLGSNWEGWITGNISLVGTAPALAGANSLITDAAEYSTAAYSTASSTGTGLYMSLNCGFSTASLDTPLPLLGSVEGIGDGLFVEGDRSCADSGTVNQWEADESGTFASLKSSALASSAWPSPGCAVQETFDRWPAMFTPVAYDAASDATDNFTASDGTTGQPYILLGTPASASTAALSPSTGGEIPAGALLGGGNQSAPGAVQASAGDSVNTDTGDYQENVTDSVIPTFGPGLGLGRNYDAEVASQETETATPVPQGAPGSMGYGWLDNWATSVTTGRPVPGDIYTIDGTETGNNNGGSPTSVPLDQPGAVVVSGGNTYIADSAENRVLEVAGTAHTEWGISMSAGDAYVIAGSPVGVSGTSSNGTAASSSLLDNPQGLTVDGSGNLYIADTGNNRVLEIPAVSGQDRGFGSMTVDDIYTIAGHGTGAPGHGGDGGSANDAFLDQPYAVSTGHGDTDIYIADTGNNRIQEVPSVNTDNWGQGMNAWSIYTVIGSAIGNAGISGDGGADTSAFLNNPSSITFSSTDDMYIADTGNNRIQEIPVASGSQWGISPFFANSVYTVAGSASGTSGHSANGTASTSALLNAPTGVIAFNGTQLYITDVGDSREQEVARSGHTEWGIPMTQNEIYTIAGTGTAGFSGDSSVATSAKLNDDQTSWLDSSFNLYIADAGNNRIREVSASTGNITEYAGDGGILFNDGNSGSAVSAGLLRPHGVITDPAGDIFIADAANNRVQEIAASSHSQFGITMTAGDVYTVAGNANGQSGTSSTRLTGPGAVALDSSGNLYIADSDNNRIQKVSASTGSVSTVAGNSAGTAGISGDSGPATSAFLNEPDGIAVDAAGDLLIGDTGNNRVEEVPATTGGGMTAGDIYTIAGSATGSSGESADGLLPGSALLHFPSGVTIDPAGDIYIADSGNNRVEEIFASGGTSWGRAMTAGRIYDVAGGSAGTGGVGDFANNAELDTPVQVAVDGSGNLYIADSENSRIMEVPVSSGTQWGQQMTADYIYTVAGSTAGTAGESGDGGRAAAALIDSAQGIAVDPFGDLLVSDDVGNSLREVIDTSGSPFAVSPQAAGITVNEPGGAQVTFYPKAGGSCSAPYVSAGSTGYCVLPQDIGVTLSVSGSTGDYTFVPAPGAGTITYNSSGALISLRDPAADTLNVSYGTPLPGSGACPATANWCETITSASGRTLTLGYSSAGFITSSTDPMGREWTYGYTGSDLTSATDPLGRKTTYTYGAGSTGNPLLANDLLTITGPNAQPAGPDAGDSSVNVYNSSGQVTRQTDPMGFVTTFSYCANAAAGDCMNQSTGSGYTTVTDPDGNATVFGYSAGVSAAATTWNGTVPSEQDSGVNLTDSGNAAGTLLPLWNSDADNNITTQVYDNLGNEISSTDPNGNTSTSFATTTNFVTCDADPMAASPCSATQTGPSPVSPGGAITPPASAPPAGVTYHLFDTDGNELYDTIGVYQPGTETLSSTQTNYNLYEGNTVTLSGTEITCASTPPAPDLPCAQVDAQGEVTQLAYDSSGDETSESTPNGNGAQLSTETATFDGDGEVTSATSPDGNVTGANAGNYTTTFTYDADGETTSQTEAAGTGATATPRTTSETYDADGDGVTATDPRGYTTSTAYDADDNATETTDPEGNKTLTCYDGNGNAVQTVPPSGVVANGLTPASCPSSYPAGFSDRLASDADVQVYDGTGNVTSETTPAPSGLTGHETVTNTYDPAGNLLQTTSPPAATGGSDQVTVNTYDPDGNLMTQTTGYGTLSAATFSACYDPDGDQTSTVAANGNATGVAPCESSYPFVVSPSSYPTQAATQTTNSFDSAGELVSATSPATAAAPSGATTTYTYDADGDQLTTTDPNGVTTTTTYSTPGGHLTGISFSGSSAHSISYTFDAEGNMTGMTDASGTSSYSYDPFGELTSSTNGAGQTTGYSYDADGDNTGITYPLPASSSWATTDTVGYGFNHADVLTSFTDFNGNQTTITPNADSQPSSVTLGATGDTESLTYDAAMQNSSVTLKNSTSTLQSFSYSDAPDGGILAETDTPASPDTSSTYAYDAQGRLASMTMGTSGPTLNYSFDESGNLTTLPTGATTTYDNAGELTTSALSGTTTDYAYNADGERLTAKQGSATMTSGAWNGADQLTSYSDAAADMTAASYDGTGMRVSDTTGSGTQDFVWAGGNLLMDSGSAYIYGLGTAPDEQVNLSTGSISYLSTDSLGSVRGIVSSSGALTATTSYDAWGNPQTSGGLSSKTPFGYAGGYTDPTGLIYLIDRYYDPQTGQFMSVDPAVDATGDPYGYGDADPVNSIDPSGNWAIALPSAHDPWTNEANFERWVHSTITGGEEHTGMYRAPVANPQKPGKAYRYVDIYMPSPGVINELKIGDQDLNPGNRDEANKDLTLIQHPGNFVYETANQDGNAHFGPPHIKSGIWWFGYSTRAACQKNVAPPASPCPSGNLRKFLVEGGDKADPHKHTKLNVILVYKYRPQDLDFVWEYAGHLFNSIAELYAKNHKQIRQRIAQTPAIECPTSLRDYIPFYKYPDFSVGCN